MSHETYRKYTQLQAELESDAQYRYLHEVRRSMEPEFLALLRTLPTEQSDLIREYLGICGEISQRETELACTLP